MIHRKNSRVVREGIECPVYTNIKSLLEIYNKIYTPNSYENQPLNVKLVLFAFNKITPLKAIAKHLGIHYKTILTFVHGTRKPAKATTEKIEAFLANKAY